MGKLPVKKNYSVKQILYLNGPEHIFLLEALAEV